MITLVCSWAGACVWILGLETESTFAGENLRLVLGRLYVMVKSRFRFVQ
jgi:hypothetical protein